MLKNFCDMHCDTLTELYTKKQSFTENNLHISLQNASFYEKYCQVFAIWTPDELIGEQRFENFMNVYNAFLNSKPQNVSICKSSLELEAAFAKKEVVAILAVEGAGVLNGDIQRVKLLADLGVRFMTLTWNGCNELGDGIRVENAGGLTDFGVKAIKEMEKENIIIDVSHLSEQGFYDVCSIATKPFVATHSNAKTVCKHFRNLTDAQFKEIVKRKGLVGINLCAGFLNDDEENANIDDIVKHIEHFIRLGGEDVIAFGADFDGVEHLPKGIKTIKDIEKIAVALEKADFSSEIMDKIFFHNFMRFCKENIL